MYLTSEQIKNNPMFLRNQFKGEGQLDIPIIKKQDINIENISLIGYNQLSPNIEKYDDFVHFFIDDYRFEVMWNNPELRIAKLNKCKGVLSPQFSTYYTMPQQLQIYNTFRSRWCGAYFQSKGLKVIPTVSWGMPESYWYCFDGIENGSIVAISTLGVKKEKDFFLQGYKEMLKRIQPKAIICYSTPFEEMEGNIIYIDYAETNNLDSKLFSVDTYTMQPIGDYILRGMGGGGSGTPKFPGQDPSVSPGKNYEWRGKGDPASGRGSWVNPKTNEVLHPDLNHSGTIGPHWDYTYPGSGNGFRLFPNGTMVPKFYEGDIIYA